MAVFSVGQLSNFDCSVCFCSIYLDLSGEFERTITMIVCDPALSASFYRLFLRYHFGGKYSLRVLTPSRAFIAYSH